MPVRVPRRRTRGACLQCARRKRKCDHKRPDCSQCLKHGETCEPQIFKSWTVLETPDIASTPAEGPANRHSTGIHTTVVLEEWATDENISSLMSRCDGALEITSNGNDDIQAILPEENSDVGWSEQWSQSYQQELTPRQALNASGTAILAYDMRTTDLMADLLAATTSSPPWDLNLQPESLTPWAAPTLSLTYCPVPWPDDMLASPKRQFFWQYFIHSLQAGALCIDWEDVSNVPGFQDPFIVTIPHLAITNPVLRSAVLCFSMYQYNGLHNQMNLDGNMVSAWREACRGLATQLDSLRQDDSWSVLALISASTLLHWCAPEKKKDYLQLASRLAVAFLKRSRSNSNIPNVFRESILTSFRWTTISALCSLQPPSSLLSDEVCSVIELDHAEIGQNYSTSFQSWISHPIYAFSARLVNPLLRIGQLAEAQLSQQKLGQGISDNALEQKISSLEEMLLNARDTELDVITSPTGSADPVSVASLNEAMHAASVILFYTRFRGLPFTAPLIRRQVQTVIHEICKTSVDSRVSYAIVFPLFVAGCETVDSQLRDIITDRLRSPKGLFFDRGDIPAALHHIWEIRDLQPGLVWPEWVDQVEPQFRISNLF